MNDSDAIEISEAIERSRSTGQICGIKVGANVAQLEQILLEVAQPSSIVKIEGGQVEVWGWSYDTTAYEEWRLVIECAPVEEMVA